MLGALRRNLVLLAIAIAAVLVFTRMTLPAIERNRALAEVERQALEERERLREEAERLRVQLEALEQDDPVLLERAVRRRFQLGGEPPASSP